VNRKFLKPEVISDVPKPKERPAPYQIEHNCMVSEDIWYYDHFRETTAPPSIYQYLVSKAKQRVWIWDTHLHDGEEEILSSIKKHVDVRILTCFGMQKNTIPKRMEAFFNSLKSLQKIAQFGLKVNVYNMMLDPGKQPFHDRYLIVDDQIYIVGSSIGYHHRRITSTSIHMIQSEASKDLIYDRFLYNWNHRNAQQVLFIVGGLLT